MQKLLPLKGFATIIDPDETSVCEGQILHVVTEVVGPAVLLSRRCRLAEANLGPRESTTNTRRNPVKSAMTVLCVICGVLLCCCEASGIWPMFQKDPSHSGKTTQDGAEENYTAWTVSIPAPPGWGTKPLIWASPILGYGPVSFGGAVFVATRNGYVYCLDLGDGDLLWAVQVADTISATPALSGGYLYLLGGAGDRKLHCIDAADGDSVWATELGSNWHFGSGGRTL